MTLTKLQEAAVAMLLALREEMLRTGEMSDWWEIVDQFLKCETVEAFMDGVVIPGLENFGEGEQP